MRHIEQRKEVSTLADLYFYKERAKNGAKFLCRTTGYKDEWYKDINIDDIDMADSNKTILCVMMPAMSGKKDVKISERKALEILQLNYFSYFVWDYGFTGRTIVLPDDLVWENDRDPQLVEALADECAKLTMAWRELISDLQTGRKRFKLVA